MAMTEGENPELELPTDHENLFDIVHKRKIRNKNKTQFLKIYFIKTIIR